MIDMSPTVIVVGENVTDSWYFQDDVDVYTVLYSTKTIKIMRKKYSILYLKSSQLTSKYLKHYVLLERFVMHDDFLLKVVVNTTWPNERSTIYQPNLN